MEFQPKFRKNKEKLQKWIRIGMIGGRSVSRGWCKGTRFERMTQKHKIQLFEEKKVRTVWDDEQEKWYFAIVDVCAVLAESDNPQVYWRVLKSRLKKEGNETVTNCNALKMPAPDGMWQRDKAGMVMKYFSKAS